MRCRTGVIRHWPSVVSAGSLRGLQAEVGHASGDARPPVRLQEVNACELGFTYHFYLFSSKGSNRRSLSGVIANYVTSHQKSACIHYSNAAPTNILSVNTTS